MNSNLERPNAVGNTDGSMGSSIFDQSLAYRQAGGAAPQHHKGWIHPHHCPSLIYERAY